MKKNVKDVHVYIDYQLAIELDKLAKDKKIQISELYNQLLPLGLSNYLLNENINNLREDLNRIIKANNYAIGLSEQIYADLNLSLVSLNANVSRIQVPIKHPVE